MFHAAPGRTGLGPMDLAVDASMDLVISAEMETEMETETETETEIEMGGVHQGDPVDQSDRIVPIDPFVVIDLREMIVIGVSAVGMISI